MFQSVMTRVGSNGRLPGAYPMDAPPIEECAKTRGVVDFARRYGYGYWSEDSEDEDDSFGEIYFRPSLLVRAAKLGGGKSNDQFH